MTNATCHDDDDDSNDNETTNRIRNDERRRLGLGLGDDDDDDDKDEDDDDIRSKTEGITNKTVSPFRSTRNTTGHYPGLLSHCSPPDPVSPPR